MLYRLFFNRCEDWPQIWSIDEGPGTPESNVCDWRTEGHVPVSAGRVPDLASVADKAREPVAWNVIDAASVRLENGVAVFRDALSESA